MTGGAARKVARESNPEQRMTPHRERFEATKPGPELAGHFDRESGRLAHKKRKKTQKREGFLGDLLISKELSTLFGFKMSKITPCTVDPGFQGLPPAILRWSRRGHSRRRHRVKNSHGTRYLLKQAALLLEEGSRW